METKQVLGKRTREQAEIGIEDMIDNDFTKEKSNNTNE
jgi:hypothetical protein